MCNCTFDKGENCAALVTHDCEKCSFRKTKEELLAGRRKAKARLDKLPEKKRKSIEEKYYIRNGTKHEV